MREVFSVYQEREYEGKKYRRYDAKWVDESGMVVPVVLQNALNKLAFAEESLDEMDYATAKSEGDKFKKSESYLLAVRYYEVALSKATTRGQIASLLPRMTSCYRRIHRPQRVIELMSAAKEKYGEEIVTEILLTSVAAAYCDLDQPENAIRCCRWAYSVLRSKTEEFSGELANVFQRAKKMLGEED
jgi:hypothetical protein